MSATKLLDRLTPEQEAMLPAISDEWIAIGLSTEPTDRAASQAAISAAYRQAGLEPPAIWLWMPSPLHGAMCRAFVTSPQVRDQVWDQVRDQVWDQVSAQVSAQVWDQVRDQVRDRVWDQVLDQVWDQVRDQVWDQVWDRVWDQDWWRNVCYGTHDAPWLSWCDTFRRFGVQGIERIATLFDVARTTGWWWPYRGVCIVTPRASSLYRDERGQLHNERGPAMAWGDDWAIWAWHGTRVPQDVIEQPEALTAERVLTEQNAEVARAMYEIMGADRFLAECNPKVIDTDMDGARMARRLLRTSATWADEPLVAVEVRCPSTDHVYYLTVPPHTRTCAEGVAWTQGMDAAAYQPLIEA